MTGRGQGIRTNTVFAIEFGRGNILFHSIVANGIAELRIAKLCRANSLLLFLDPSSALQCDSQGPLQHLIGDRNVWVWGHQLDQAADGFLDAGCVAAA